MSAAARSAEIHRNKLVIDGADFPWAIVGVHVEHGADKLTTLEVSIVVDGPVVVLPPNTAGAR